MRDSLSLRGTRFKLRFNVYLLWSGRVVVPTGIVPTAGSMAPLLVMNTVAPLAAAAAGPVRSRAADGRRVHLTTADYLYRAACDI